MDAIERIISKAKRFKKRALKLIDFVKLGWEDNAITRVCSVHVAACGVILAARHGGATVKLPLAAAHSSMPADILLASSVGLATNAV